MPRPRGVSPPPPKALLIASCDDPLPYVLEVWDREGTAPESIIAAAADLGLLQSMLNAALREYPQRTLSLRRGSQMLHVVRGDAAG